MSWEILDSMDWRLWVLALLLITVLGAGVLSLMFPAVFWSPERLAVKAPDRVFWGFSVLLAISLFYLLRKQATLRELKRQLIQAQAALAAAERTAAMQLFETLPSITQFRDTLAMEYRRASTSDSSLAVLLLLLPRAVPETLGRVTRVLHSMLRQGESLYRISDRAIGVILPGMSLSRGAAFAGHVESLCAFVREELEVRITSYPDDVSSLTELEGKLRHSADDLDDYSDGLSANNRQAPAATRRTL